MRRNLILPLVLPTICFAHHWSRLRVNINIYSFVLLFCFVKLFILLIVGLSAIIPRLDLVIALVGAISCRFVLLFVVLYFEINVNYILQFNKFQVLDESLEKLI
jgi:hypothetical protein